MIETGLRLGNTLALCSLCFLLSRSGVPLLLVAIVADLGVLIWAYTRLRGDAR